MLFKRLLVVAMLLLTTGPTLAQPQCTANGCGSGWNRWLVPNQPLGTSFLSACTAQDHCYGGCPISANRQGLYSCTKGITKVIDPRGCCDDSFLRDLVNICRSEAPSKKLCRLAAVLYYLAVDTFGDSAFVGKGLKDWMRDDASTDDDFPTLLFEQSAYIAAAIGSRTLFDQSAKIQLNADGTILVRVEQRTLIASTNPTGVEILADRNRRLRGNTELFYGDLFELSGVSRDTGQRIRDRLGQEALRTVPKK